MGPRQLKKVLVVAALLAGGVIVSHTGAGAQSAMSDKDYTMFAARSSMAEIREAQIALQKSKNENVQRYAKMIVDDHTAANADLAKVASSENVPLPKTLAADQESEAAALSGVSAADFDKTYMNDQVSGHYKVVASTQAEVSSGSSAAVKGYATNYLAAEQRHLRMAQAMVQNADRYLK